MENTLSALLYGEQLIRKWRTRNLHVIRSHSGNYNHVPGAKSVVAFVLYAVLMVSCHDRSVLPAGYVQYVTDSCNGLRKTQGHAKIIFTAQYEHTLVITKGLPLITMAHTISGWTTRRRRSTWIQRSPTTCWRVLLTCSTLS